MDRVPFKDMGENYYNKFNTESKINMYLKKLKALGVSFDVEPIAVPS